MAHERLFLTSLLINLVLHDWVHNTKVSLFKVREVFGIKKVCLINITSAEIRLFRQRMAKSPVSSCVLSDRLVSE